MKYSIKTIWLSFIAVVVLLPSVIIIPWFAYYEFDRQLSDVLLHESLLNAELEKKLEYELNHFINLLENKSDPIGYELVAQRDKNLIHPLLEIIMKREKAIHGLLVVSDRGEIKASMDRLGNEVYRLEKPEGITDASWIKTHWGLLWEKTFRSPEFVVPVLGRKYISPASEHEGTYLFRISLPVLYKGKTKGFLIAEISIDNLWNNWKHVGSDIGNNSYMVDRRGVLLVDVQYGKYRAGDLLTHLAIVRDGISSRRGINNDAYKGVSGKQVFGTTQTIPLLNWTLVSEVNERSIIKPIRQTILTAVFLAILLITICLLIGMRMMRAFIFPIENLTSAIEMYGHDEAALKQTPETNIKELNTVIKGFNRMVVERSQMDDVLRSSKERLLLHRDQSPLGVIEWNTKFEFVDWNPAAEKIFCFTKNEVLGKHITETILPESARQIVDEIWQALLQQTGGTHSINENMTKDGRIILCEWHNTPLVNKAGKIVGIASFVEDITDKKLQEEQNRRSQKMDALGKLTGGISHDFNNLLNAILGYANLISERAENEKLKKFADIIIQAGKRGTKLTKKLLSFSAQEAGKLSIVDINSLIKDEEHILEKSLTARIELRLDLTESPWPLYLDSGDLQDAVLNMSINAMHAIEGSGRLTITTRNEQLDEGKAKGMEIPAGDYLMLKVSDNGCGMDKETMSHIFDPFFSTKGELGTGLGLSQVYGFIKRSGGGLYVNSEPGVGTELVMYFPRYQQSIDETPEQESTDKNKTLLRGSEIILVVDDDDGLRELNMDLLEGHGYQVICASHAEEAVNILEQQKVDLVLSDVVMPRVDGYQLATQIQLRWPEIKIQMVSGFSDGHHEAMKDDSLHRNLMKKPYDVDELLKRIRQVLDD